MIAATTLLATPVVAQQVRPCFEGANIPFEATVAAIAEPWEKNTRSFADGDIRIVVMDTWEPAFGAYYLMVLFWSGENSEAELRLCDLVSLGELGFVGMTLNGMEASYKPDSGLVLQVPTTFYNPQEDEFEEGVIEVEINRATNQVTAIRP